MKKTIIYLFIITISGILTSCDDWLTIQPEETLSKDEMFESKTGFYDALYGIYTLCDNNYGHNGNLITYTIEHMGAQWEVKAESPEEKLKTHQYTALDNLISNIFSNQYKVIANINLMLEYLETQKFLDDEDYKQLKGECLGLRAWLHFDLIRLWGPVPGNVNKSKKYLPYVTTLTHSRHAYLVYNEYMELLLADMEEAESLLADLPVEKNFRLNHLGVKALMARISLWQQDKETALNYANAVLDFVATLGETDENQNYYLATLNNIGRGDYTFDSEHLFGRYDDFESTAFRNNLYNNTAYLYELYEYSASDIRYMQWEDRDVEGLDAPAMNLLKYVSGEGSVSVIRLSEIYFIAMECGTLSLANELYEYFCQERGIPFDIITGQQQLNNLLFKEYRKEFIGEGVMFYYYKRHFTKNIPRNPEVCNESCYVLPLPKNEINVNF